ncbi:MAG: tryptophan--tRNA ligase [Candidatus Omnitrophica bacterium]|nr:tryptophan--tRNA ligase [Candidatus Omnitrophota bacterium]
MKKTVFSGMRPTGKLHLGHLVGALHNWVRLQDTHRCIYSVVDWHALMGEYEHSQNIKSHIMDMALDWLACGIDPERSIIFVQSEVPEHLELQMVLSCLTPLGWLERNPTYKEQLREITTRDLQTYAFLGYPVLQAADILLYKATAVPIGEDQIPHLELTREIARRFNTMYGKQVFSDCEAILTPTPRLLGLDGRKMSKSYQNTINLSDSPEDIYSKVKNMMTDPKRQRLKDPGHPDECNVFSYYKVFAPAKELEVRDWCENARKGCTECKKILADEIIEYLRPIREKRLKLEASQDYVRAILKKGAAQAREIAALTMAEVKAAVFK